MTLIRRILNPAEKQTIYKDLAPLFLRLILAYGFWSPAIMKWQNLEGIASWFESMGVPLPMFMTVMTAATELLGVVLLTIGLGTRFISFALIIVMIVAIFTVHIDNGFKAGDNGFEIPFYYILMLFSLIAFGAGRLSLDGLFSKK